MRHTRWTPEWPRYEPRALAGEALTPLIQVTRRGTHRILGPRLPKWMLDGLPKTNDHRPVKQR